MEWITDNSDFIINWAGLILTIIGFLITAREIRKSKQALRDAIRQISNRLLFNELKSSSKTLAELRDSCRSGNWYKAIDRCDQLKEDLSSLVEQPLVNESERNTLAEAIDDVTLILRHIEQNVDKQKPLVIKPNMFQAMDKMGTLLYRLDARLRNNLMEITDAKQ